MSHPTPTHCATARERISMPEHRCYCCGSTQIVIFTIEPLCPECAHAIIDQAAKVAERERQVQAWKRTPEGQTWIADTKARLSLKRAIAAAA
jgi:hypothetical protein